MLLLSEAMIDSPVMSLRKIYVILLLNFTDTKIYTAQAVSKCASAIHLGSKQVVNVFILLLGYSTEWALSMSALDNAADVG